MSKTLIRSLLLGSLAVTAVAAQADDDRRRSPAAPAAAGTVVATAVGVGTTTPATTPAAPAAGAQTLGPAGEGRRLYLKLNCYSCHGMAGGGGMGPRIAGTEFGDVSEAVLQGEDGGMRNYRGLVSSTDITNLSAYLRSIGTAAEPKFRDWWVTNPTK